MKRKIFLAAFLALCLATLGAGSLAYFTAEDIAHNVITSGSVHIQIVEKTQGADGALVEFPEEGLTGIMPGSEASKIVSVKNTGEAQAWIRVKMEISVRSAQGDTLTWEQEVAGERIPLVVPNVMADWFDGGDGYYYYAYSVSPEDSTSNFLETVSFAPEMGNEYQNSTVLLVISAQAVQTANNPVDPQGYGDYAAAHAVGWPAE